MFIEVWRWARPALGIARFRGPQLVAIGVHQVSKFDPPVVIQLSLLSVSMLQITFGTDALRDALNLHGQDRSRAVARGR